MKIETLKSGKYATLKKLFIGVSVVLVVLIASVTIYFSFAKYRVTQSVPLAKGTVSYSSADLNLAVYWGDKKHNEFPKNEGENGYKFKEVTCDAGTQKNLSKSTWSDTSWSLNVEVKGPIKCWVYFTYTPKIKITSFSGNYDSKSLKVDVEWDSSNKFEVSKYFYSLDNNTWVEGTNPSHTFTTWNDSALTGKKYTVYVKAKDSDGNETAVMTSSVSWDNKAPSISITESSSEKNSVDNTWYKNYTVRLDASDNDNNLKEFKYCLSTDGNQCTPSITIPLDEGGGKTKSFTYAIPTGSTEQMVCVSAKDEIDNASAISCGQKVKVDHDVPTISGLTATANGKNATITISTSNDVGSGVAEYYFSTNNGTSYSKETVKNHSETLEPGTYNIKVYAKDTAGNESTTLETTLIVSNSAKDVIIKPGTSKGKHSSFTGTATTDEGIWEADDGMYGGTSYYWRGASKNNYVKFAGFMWRIIRINGDGTLRLIYDGDKAYDNGDSSNGSKRQIGTKAYNTDNSARKFVGFKYDSGEHGTTTASTILGTASDTSTLYGWYKTNIADKNLDSKVDQNGLFCNDRNATTNSSQTWDDWKKTKTDSTGSSTYYGAYMRFAGKSTATPTLSCENEDDIFSKTGSTKGNKSLTYPVGLITADEVVFAGGWYGTGNSKYYLYTGNYFWTMSPSDYPNANVFRVSSDGGLGGSNVSGTYGVRPVINLKADTTFVEGGLGTKDKPYEVS